MSRRDLIFSAAVVCIAAIVLVSCGLFAGTSDGELVAVVTSGDTVVGRYPLSRDIETEVRTDDGYNIIVVDGGEVYVKSSDCRDEICVKTRKISKEFSQIVCLPHKLVITIEREN